MTKKNTFGFLIFATVLFLVYLAHNIQGTPVLEKVKTFERKYKPVLTVLTNSLLKRKELDTNYVVELEKNNSKTYYDHELVFRYLDSSEKRGDRFEINFVLSDEQVDFFRETFTGSITYLKKNNSFTLNPAYFSGNHLQVFIVINEDSLNINRSANEKDKIFQNDNYSYYEVGY